MPSEKLPTRKIADAVTTSKKLKENPAENTEEWLDRMDRIGKEEIIRDRFDHTEGMRELIAKKAKLERTNYQPVTFQVENSSSDLSRPDLIYDDQRLDQFLTVARILYEKVTPNTP